MSRSRNRPPRLETHIGPQHAAPPPTLEELLERSHVAGRSAASSPSELRRCVERAAGDRIHSAPLDNAWASGQRVFGATIDNPRIDPALTISAARDAVARISAVAGVNGRVALATSLPA